MKQLVLVINEDSFFLSHRSRIATTAKSRGWSVILVAKNTGFRSYIEKMGIEYIDLPINPTGMNLKEEFKTFKFLYSLYRKYPDAIIHHVGLKNMLWGGLASRLTKTKGVVYAVSGLGMLFGENSRRMLSRTIQHVLGFAMGKKNVAVIFQNHDDESCFVKSGLVDPGKVEFIKGSGVDMEEFSFSEPPETAPLVIIFTARMLKEKGVLDLVAAAEILRNEYEGKIEIWLCGGLSSNPCAMTEKEMHSIADGSYIKWLGHRTDVNELLKKSSIMCFPSYYREGVPKSLIEASAIGRPIITTDSVGCRDTVVDGENGFLVPVHDPVSLAHSLKKLIDDAELRKNMGKKSRLIAERDYDVNKVADLHIEIYEKLYNAKTDK